MKYRYQRMVITLANILSSSKFGLSRSEAMKNAHETIQEHGGTAVIIKSMKKDGSITVRVARYDWTQFQEPKGGRPASPKVLVFADLAQVAVQSDRVVRSFRKDLVISINDQPYKAAA